MIWRIPVQTMIFNAYSKSKSRNCQITAKISPDSFYPLYEAVHDVLGWIHIPARDSDKCLFYSQNVVPWLSLQHQHATWGKRNKESELVK